ncbi:MAG: RidA family protein [Leucobacter sp.]|jgi:enamine deaminase RidA (YjgF/YER057c/UK114 family)|nr:RidA family protein [Leucobacter sp.]
MSRRTSIYLDGFAHKNPVPAACLIENHLTSGVLTGRDPETGEMPLDLDAQVRNVFAHVRELMRVAGGSTADIAKITVYLSDYRDREALNREWLEMFPDANDRPTRQVMHANFDGDTQVQADLVAVLALAAKGQ